jgi:hypothetical protein
MHPQVGNLYNTDDGLALLTSYKKAFVHHDSNVVYYRAEFFYLELRHSDNYAHGIFNNKEFFRHVTPVGEQ